MTALKIVVDILLVFFGASFVATAYNEYLTKSCNVTKVLCGAAVGVTFFALAFVVWNF